MEVWYDPSTMEVKAIYTHGYRGTVWADAGYLQASIPNRMRGVVPGAIIDWDGVTMTLVTSAPSPTPPPPRRDFKAEYTAATNITDQVRILAEHAGLADA